MDALCISYLRVVAARVSLKGIGTRLAGWAMGALGSLRVGATVACCFPRRAVSLLFSLSLSLSFHLRVRVRVRVCGKG